jgi:hypothetical protein
MLPLMPIVRVGAFYIWENWVGSETYVETTQGVRHGFFGLIEVGWDIEDTTGDGKRDPCPRKQPR